MDIIKIGKVELTEAEAEKICQAGKYIIAYRRIYALHYSTAQKRVYGREIYCKRDGLPITKRGRFIVCSPTDVNRLVGSKLVAE